MPYRSQFITATDDPLLHPPTRNAANPPHTLQHRFLSSDHPTAHQPHHRPALALPGGKPRNHRPALTGSRTPPLRNAAKRPRPYNQPPLALAFLPLVPHLCYPRSPTPVTFTPHHTPSPYPRGKPPPSSGERSPAAVTRLNPPLLQHRFLACDRPPAPTPTTARARRLHTLQLTRCRNVVSSSHPPHPFSVLPRGKPPHLRLPPRLCYPPTSCRQQGSTRRSAAKRPNPIPFSYPGVNRQTRRLPPRLCYPPTSRQQHPP